MKRKSGYYWVKEKSRAWAVSFCRNSFTAIPIIKEKSLTMSAKSNIIEYLRLKSGGMINITSDMADDVIAMAHDIEINKTAYAKLYRWNAAKSNYELMYTVSTTDELIQQNVHDALKKRPADQCYLWECYNSTGQFEGKIYTVNTNLF